MAAMTREPTNEERAGRAAQIVQDYVDEHGGDSDGAIRDMLADLMHYCDWYGVDFADELATARTHYHAEIAGED